MEILQNQPYLWRDVTGKAKKWSADGSWSKKRSEIFLSNTHQCCRIEAVLWNYKAIGTNPGTGLHKLWYPGIRDMSTWGKFGAHGEHGDVFLFSNLGALWFSENLIRYSLHAYLREVKNNLFSFKHLLGLIMHNDHIQYQGERSSCMILHNHHIEDHEDELFWLS